MRMKKLIFLLFAIGILLFYSACNSPISTTEEWVSFCKREPNVESVYNEFISITPSNSIAIYRALTDELSANDNCRKETCYAFVYMMSLLSMDIDSHPEKYSLADVANFNEIADNNPQYYTTAVLHAIKQTGDISTEIQTFARLTGSKMLQSNN